VALHVQHGLSPHAEDWLAHVEATCRRWARRGWPVELIAHRLESRPQAGESVEAWARRARYQALREMAQERAIDLVLLAHHRRDQAETFLLQALRGGGVAALSAMARVARRDGITWARPWLATAREEIAAYARRHRLRWIDDESNDDDRFARNRLRRHVWPALAARFGEADAALAGAAARVADAAAIVEEVAAADLATIADDERGLDLAAWRSLSVPHQSHALLRWLRLALGASPPATLVERLLREALPSGRPRRWPVPGGELRSYRGRLQHMAGALACPDRSHSILVDLSLPGDHTIAGWDGTFRVEPVSEGGLPVAHAARLELRARAPGDRFQAGRARPARSLKLQFQAAGVDPALRQGPIACHDGVPVFVAGLGLDARALAPAGAPQVALTWLAHAASGKRGPRAR
jgi:tRNA(Ile)-lysidine synthase